MPTNERIIEVVFGSHARRMETTPLTRRVSGTDAWGEVHWWDIEWMPQIVTTEQDAEPNVGREYLAWRRVCPAVVVRESTGHVGIVAEPVSVDGHLAVPVRVDTAEEMSAGTWRVVGEG